MKILPENYLVMMHTSYSKLINLSTIVRSHCLCLKLTIAARLLEDYLMNLKMEKWIMNQNIYQISTNKLINRH